MTSIEAVAREFAKELDLEGQLVLSVFLMRLKLAAATQPTDNVVELGVIDRERGWRLTED